MVLLLMMVILVMRMIMRMRMNMKMIKMMKMKWLLQAAPSLLLCGLSCSSGAL